MQYRGTSYTVVLLALVSWLGGCEREGLVEVEVPDDAFNFIQAEIFDLNCALPGCHATAVEPHQLNLSAGQAYGNLVGISARANPDLLRVDPGNPDDSFLIVKLEGGPADKFRGLRMPLGGQPLSDTQIQTIRDWIIDGAPRE